MSVYPDNKGIGDNTGPTWGRHDPGGPHVGHVNLAIMPLEVSRHYCVERKQLINR